MKYSKPNSRVDFSRIEEESICSIRTPPGTPQYVSFLGIDEEVSTPSSGLNPVLLSGFLVSGITIGFGTYYFWPQIKSKVLEARNFLEQSFLKNKKQPSEV